MHLLELLQFGGVSIGTGASVAIANFWNPVGWIVGGATVIAVGYSVYTSARQQEAQQQKDALNQAVAEVQRAKKLLADSNLQNVGQNFAEAATTSADAVLEQKVSGILTGQLAKKHDALQQSVQATKTIYGRLQDVLSAVDQILHPSLFAPGSSLGEAGNIAKRLLNQGLSKDQITADAVLAASRIYNHTAFGAKNWNSMYTADNKKFVGQVFNQMGLTDPTTSGLNLFLNGTMPDQAFMDRTNSLNQTAIQDQINLMAFNAKVAAAAAQGDVSSQAYVDAILGTYLPTNPSDPNSGVYEASYADVAHAMSTRLFEARSNLQGMQGPAENPNAQALSQQNFMTAMSAAGVAYNEIHQTTSGLGDETLHSMGLWMNDHSTLQGWVDTVNYIAAHPSQALGAGAGATLGLALTSMTGGISAELTPLLASMGAALAGGTVMASGVESMIYGDDFTTVLGRATATGVAAFLLTAPLGKLGELVPAPGALSRFFAPLVSGLGPAWDVALSAGDTALTATAKFFAPITSVAGGAWETAVELAAPGLDAIASLKPVSWATGQMAEISATTGSWISTGGQALGELAGMMGSGINGSAGLVKAALNYSLPMLDLSPLQLTNGAISGITLLGRLASNFMLDTAVPWSLKVFGATSIGATVPGTAGIGSLAPSGFITLSSFFGAVTAVPKILFEPAIEAVNDFAAARASAAASAAGGGNLISQAANGFLSDSARLVSFGLEVNKTLMDMAAFGVAGKVVGAAVGVATKALALAELISGVGFAIPMAGFLSSQIQNLNVALSSGSAKDWSNFGLELFKMALASAGLKSGFDFENGLFGRPEVPTEGPATAMPTESASAALVEEAIKLGTIAAIGQIVPAEFTAYAGAFGPIGYGALKGAYGLDMGTKTAIAVQVGTMVDAAVEGDLSPTMQAVRDAAVNQLVGRIIDLVPTGSIMRTARK